MTRHRPWPWVALAALAGCIQGANSTPPPAPTVPGADVRVAFSWVINGQDPTTTDACGDGAVEFIRMTVLDGATGTQTVTTLNWACSLGRWRSPQPQLRAGDYRVYWEAVSHEGRALSVAPGHADPATHAVTPSPELVTLLAGETHDFDATNTTVTGQPGHPTNFATASAPLEVSLRYSGPGSPAAGSTCAELGVETIHWRLMASNGLVVEDHATPEACAHYAQVRWDTLLRDRYSLEVIGSNAAGAVGWQSTCEGLTVRAGPAATRLDCVITRAPAL